MYDILTNDNKKRSAYQSLVVVHPSCKIEADGDAATGRSFTIRFRDGSKTQMRVPLVNPSDKKKGGGGVFIDKSDPDTMSDTLRYFVRGIIDHGAACMALFNPTPNCYRRLRPHTFAPSNISWGEEDRSAMVRIKSPGSKAMHVEMRAASALSNPYLTAAGTLACGLLGLKEKRKLRHQSDGPSEEDASLPLLPHSLDEALALLNADKALCGLLGAEFVDVFTTVKRYELARFNDHISQWESDEYLELY